MKRVLVLLLILALPAANSAAAPSEQAQALHLANRIGYGPRPGELERIVAIDAESYLDQQLHPETLAEPEVLTRELAGLETLNLSVGAAFARYTAPGESEATPAESKRLRKDFSRLAIGQARTARLLRAMTSPRQLQEVMVDFWFNHFNVYASKGHEKIWVGPFEREAIRPRVFGKFRDLLRATAHHPAMLFYLDNFLSRAPGTNARGSPVGLNENYARELMELHTLGVDGGYTQRDVTELARILTGWTFDRGAMRREPDVAFKFDARLHDRGEKTFLGQNFQAGGGVEEGERALDILARQPATAQHLALLLAQRFVADTPPPALVARVARRFTATDGDIRETLRELLTSAEFRDAADADTKFKTPYEFVVSALRAADFSTARLPVVFNALTTLGMPLYECQTPNGYDDTRAAWLNPAAILRRINFTVALGRGRLSAREDEDVGPRRRMSEPNNAPPPSNGREPAPQAEALLATLGPAIGVETRRRVAEAAPALRSALILGSPDFMRR